MGWLLHMFCGVWVNHLLPCAAAPQWHLFGNQLREGGQSLPELRKAVSTVLLKLCVTVWGA